jgi:hypothetical protein
MQNDHHNDHCNDPQQQLILLKLLFKSYKIMHQSSTSHKNKLQCKLQDMEHGFMNYSYNTQQTLKCCFANINKQLPLGHVPCIFMHN